MVVMGLVVGVVVFLVVVVGEPPPPPPPPPPSPPPPPPPPPPPSRQKGPSASVAKNMDKKNEHNQIELGESDERTAVAKGVYTMYETLS
jgi:hypothetical protein